MSDNYANQSTSDKYGDDDVFDTVSLATLQTINQLTIDNINGGVDYNGVVFDMLNGITITSLANIVTLNATKGFEVKRKSDNAIMISLDSVTGNATFGGTINTAIDANIGNNINLGNVTDLNSNKAIVWNSSRTNVTGKKTTISTTTYYELQLNSDLITLTSTSPSNGLGTSIQLGSGSNADLTYNAYTHTFNTGVVRFGNSIMAYSGDLSVQSPLHFDASVSSGLRLLTSGTTAYVQAGIDNTDAASVLKLCRTLSTSSNINQLYLYADNLYMPTQTTTASAANMFVNSSGGLISRSTSALKYKKDVEDLWDSEYMKVLNLRPVWYRSKGSLDRPDWSYVGIIADEAKDILPRLVSYKDSGFTTDGELTPTEQLEVEGFQYERLAVMLIPIVKKLWDKVMI